MATRVTNILVLQVLEQLQLSVGPFGKHRGAEGLHDLLDGDILAGELISGGTVCEPRLAPPHATGGVGDVHTKPGQMLPCQPAGGRNISR